MSKKTLDEGIRGEATIQNVAPNFSKVFCIDLSFDI